MLLLGIDIGTSSIKVSIVHAGNGSCIASAHYPEKEAEIIAVRPGWAEQDPETWFDYFKLALDKIRTQGKVDLKEVLAIGISYQMHGLVLVDKDQNVLRNSIIWCDSRAVALGEGAAAELGEDYCSNALLNSPGNFTAAKLAWVKQNEPGIYARADKFMLPGDYLAMKLTGDITTTPSALSEGIFWDFKENDISEKLMNAFGFKSNIIPDVKPVFASHGRLLAKQATLLGLPASIPVSYKAGDQLNNALSLNVFEPGEVAATAGTSGVIYAVTSKNFSDRSSRVNAFAHVNHNASHHRLGVLLCINGTGILNRWMRDNLGHDLGYHELNELASKVPAGSDGLLVLPFGNGAERILENKYTGTQVLGLDLVTHTRAHMFRAAQEGIAFSFRYGLDIMRENGLNPQVIRAGRANMFLSDVFLESFVNITSTPVELYENDGSVGAALGAGLGAGIFHTREEAFRNQKMLKKVDPVSVPALELAYQRWKQALESALTTYVDK